jgi:exodeoxyribonuclease VII large subunit
VVEKNLNEHSFQMNDTASRKVLTVREVLGQARFVLERQIGSVWVEGECSNVSTPSSGHIYFTLKDEHSQLQAAWFKGSQSPEAVLPKNGMKVRVQGRVTAYERASQVQLVVKQVEDAGLGDLQRRFAELKAKLEKEGLFDPGRKKPLPVLPVRIGVITSPTGAAVQDILNVLTRRYPDREILLAPVPVQGDAAAPSIAKAISYFTRNPQEVDVLIVGRGGGSLEDLWAFNEEMVARALADCPVPTISAVGHETDFTISDFVADLRAPTPSAAAELVIGRKQDFEEQVARMQYRCTAALDRCRLELRSRLSRLRAHRLFHEPAKVVATHRQRISRAEDRLQRALLREVRVPQQLLTETAPRLRISMEARVTDQQRFLDELQDRMQRAAAERMRDQKQSVTAARQQLHALNPYEVLRRGFSISRDKDGNVITIAHPPSTGQKIQTLLHGGTIESDVTDIIPEG